MRRLTDKLRTQIEFNRIVAGLPALTEIQLHNIAQLKRLLVVIISSIQETVKFVTAKTGAFKLYHDK